jgi:hypothetical protein
LNRNAGIENDEGVGVAEDKSPRKRHPHREDPRPQHFHLSWPVSGLASQGHLQKSSLTDQQIFEDALTVLPSHAQAQWY